MKEIKEIRTGPIDFDDLVTFDFIHSLPLYQRIIIDDTINTKIISTPNHIKFITEVPPFAAMKEQFHDCVEICEPLSGTLGCKLSNRKWTVGQKAVFGVGKKHIPWNPSPNIPLFVTVDFYR